MSLLLPDELRIVLAPDHLALLRTRQGISLRGLTRRVAARELLACDETASAEAPWQAAVKVLEAALPGMATRKDRVMLILSSHFVRYALVPWSDALSDEAERMAYARHCFRQAYGTADENLDIRLSPAPAGMPQFACAVDGRLLQALRGMFALAGVTLKSVQPGLMAAYNNCRQHLQQHSMWFVLYEPGRLSVAMLQHGHWASVHSMRIGEDWREQLPQILDREACMGISEAVPENVFVWSPSPDDVVLPDGGQWLMQYLKPALRRGLEPEQEGRFAMALSG